MTIGTTHKEMVSRKAFGSLPGDMHACPVPPDSGRSCLPGPQFSRQEDGPSVSIPYRVFI